jgi:hypothetical protein
MSRLTVASLIVIAWVYVLPGAEPEARYAFIDLQTKANVDLLDGLPLGEQKFESIPFRIGARHIALGGTLKPDGPDKIEIPVQRKFSKLFILRATSNGGYPDPTHPTHIKDGSAIGQYMVRYADGGAEGIPVVYGEDVRDWWNWDKSKETKRGKIIWTGTNPGARVYDLEIRLYESEWMNPKPDIEVQSILYSSHMNTPGAPFCAALTVR